MSMNAQIFPGIPLIESPLFEAGLDSWHLSPNEKNIAVQLNRNGFAVFDFPDLELEARIERIKAQLSPMFGLRVDEGGGVNIDVNGRVQDAWKFNEDVKAIAANQQVLDLLSKLYGRRAFPFQTLNFPVGTQQAGHTDAVHFSSLPERFMCGVWLAMEDIGPDAGPLFYVPGSHRWPILHNGLIGRRGWGSERQSAQGPFQQAFAALVEANGAKEETFLARKGQALIWCANLLHGGSPHLDRRLTRWSQVTHYYFEDCIYYTPAFSDEALGRLELRDIVSAADGKVRPNRYLGETIMPPKNKRGVKGAIKQAAGRFRRYFKR